MPPYVVAMAGLAAGIAVVSVSMYHVLFIGPKLRSIDRTLRGDDDPVDAESLARLRLAHERLERQSATRLEALERLVHEDLMRVGFVRFNAFSDVGSDQSFALALLSELGDGVVVTSIHSREDTRTYGKAVRRFVPAQGASQEEQTAISLTRQSIGRAGG